MNCIIIKIDTRKSLRNFLFRDKVARRTADYYLAFYDEQKSPILSLLRSYKIYCVRLVMLLRDLSMNASVDESNKINGL